MLILIILSLLFVIGIFLVKISLTTDDAKYNIGIVICAFSSVLLATGLMVIPVYRNDINQDIQSYYFVKEVAEQTQEKTPEIQLKIKETNHWLNKIQRYNHSPLSLWIPNKVDELEPIK